MRRLSLSVYSKVQLGALGALLLSVVVLGLLALQTHNAICSFRGDLEQRIENNQVLLNDHPGDQIISAYGLQIPRTVLENNLRGQRATLASLDSGWPPLSC